jgi:hypothetical protein
MDYKKAQRNFVRREEGGAVQYLGCIGSNTSEYMQKIIELYTLNIYMNHYISTELLKTKPSSILLRQRLIQKYKD